MDKATETAVDLAKVIKSCLFNQPSEIQAAVLYELYLSWILGSEIVDGNTEAVARHRLMLLDIFTTGIRDQINKQL